MHLTPFINHLRITLKSSTQTKMKPFYCTKFVIAPVKDFRLVRETQECTTVLFHRKKTKKKYQNSKENMLLKTCFRYL